MAAKIKTLRLIGKILIINATFGFLTLHGSMAAEKLTVYVVNYPLQYFAE